MIVKVFAEGQVVIPASIRQKLGIAVGERLEVRVDDRRGVIELSRTARHEAQALAGSLAAYALGRAFPGRKAKNAALIKGLAPGTRRRLREQREEDHPPRVPQPERDRQTA